MREELFDALGRARYAEIVLQKLIKAIEENRTFDAAEAQEEIVRTLSYVGITSRRLNDEEKGRC